MVFFTLPADPALITPESTIVVFRELLMKLPKPVIYSCYLFLLDSSFCFYLFIF